LDPSADYEFVAGHQLIAEDAGRGGADTPAQVLGGAVVDQLVDAFRAGEYSAGPYDRCDTNAS
jgi:hypothetical protein